MKNNLQRNGILLLCSLLWATVTVAQSPLTLNEAIAAGIKNNPNLQAAQLDSKMQLQLVKSAYELPQTEFTGTFGQINTKANDRNFAVSQTFSPFQYGAKKKLLQANSALSTLQAAQTQQELIFSIRQSWNAMLYYAELNKIMEKHNSLMKRFVRSASLKFDTGETNALEKTTAVAKQQELEQQIKQNQALLWVEQSKLKTYLNDTGDFRISDTLLTALPALTVLDSSMVVKNNVLQVAAENVRVAEAATKVQRSTLMPDVTAGYFIQSFTGNQEVNGATVYYDGTPRFQGFTVGISLPLFAGSGVAKIKAAKTNIEIRQKDAEYLQAQLKNQFYQLREQLATYESLIAYYKTTALPNAETMTENASKAYRNGDISYVEYVQAVETAMTIRTNYLNALNKYNQTVINLQFMVNQ